MTTTAQQKVVQYLGEARASERALTRQLQSQIAITPRGSYRTALETHLRETRGHAERITERLEDLGERSNPVATAIGAAQSLAGQAPSEEAFAAAADLAAEDCSPTSDQRGSEEYKRHLARELTLRALRTATARALREEN